MKITGSLVDSTRFSAVAVCRVPSCGWRALASSRPEALAAAARHEAIAHPQDGTARNARDQSHRRRHG